MGGQNVLEGQESSGILLEFFSRLGVLVSELSQEPVEGFLC
jgi:hypothetical protein